MLTELPRIAANLAIRREQDRLLAPLTPREAATLVRLITKVAERGDDVGAAAN